MNPFAILYCKKQGRPQVVICIGNSVCWLAFRSVSYWDRGAEKWVWAAMAWTVSRAEMNPVTSRYPQSLNTFEDGKHRAAQIVS